MKTKSNLAIYSDVKMLMLGAIHRSVAGVRVADKNAAISLRHRIYKYRKALRAEADEVQWHEGFEPDFMMQFEALRVKHNPDEDPCWLEFEWVKTLGKITLVGENGEELTSVDAANEALMVLAERKRTREAGGPLDVEVKLNDDEDLIGDGV